jgi:4-hydroxybenzoate polyprenyltransferase
MNKHIIKLLRPHQYVKNLFIFAPLFFSFNLNTGGVMAIYSVVSFILFSIIASAIYILNDIKDIEEDKRHPTKRFRPLASEEVSLNSAKVLFISLASFSLIGAFIFNINLFFVLLIYFSLNIAYSFGLKHISIIDIFIISSGFVLRLFAGSIVTGITLSHWIIIMTFLLALFLAIAKRRDDVLLSNQGKNTRKNIDGYNLEFINASMVLMSGVIIVSYILYTVSNDIIDKFHTSNLYITTFFIILGILRYMQITFVEQKSGSPTKIVLKDRFLQFTIILWLISFIGIIKL